MVLTISSLNGNASDLSYLMHKHPDSFQSVSLSIGKAHIFYPSYEDTKTTIALLLDIDPIDLVRHSKKNNRTGFNLGQYVNDRPYVSSSFMSVSLSKAFSTAMNGKCTKKPHLVDKYFDFEVTISALPVPNGGERLIRQFFEPLGYQVEVQRYELDEQFVDWGSSKYYSVHLKNTLKLKDLLSHLYVLIPALDDEKHYYVSKNEIDKLTEKGRIWLPTHPNRKQIINRYLIHLKSLTIEALGRINSDSEQDHNDVDHIPKRPNLHQIRLQTIVDRLVEFRSKSIIDLGCGEGKLLKMLLRYKQFESITGVDVSYNELLWCKKKLYYDDMAPRQKERLSLFQGSLTYRDERFAGYDAAVLSEVIEHMDVNRLAAFEKVVFKYARPKVVLITTPNAEYNVLFESLKAGKFRHDDHRFEWTREEFMNWANRVGSTYDYSVRFESIGEETNDVGAPSQMAIFTYEY